MSDNVCCTKRLHVNAYVQSSRASMPMLPPMILGPEFGEMPKDPPGAEMRYVISSKEGTVDLIGWEAVLVPIAILRDALYRESALKGIRKPSREQLEKLREAVDKIEALIPHE